MGLMLEVLWPAAVLGCSRMMSHASPLPATRALVKRDSSTYGVEPKGNSMAPEALARDGVAAPGTLRLWRTLAVGVAGCCEGVFGT